MKIIIEINDKALEDELKNSFFSGELDEFLETPSDVLGFIVENCYIKPTPEQGVRPIISNVKKSFDIFNADEKIKLGKYQVVN